MQPLTKKCSKCSEYKEPTEFYAHGKTKQGTPRKSHRCKKCDNARTREAKKYKSPTKSRLIGKIFRMQTSNSKRRGHAPQSYSLTELRIWMLSQDEFHKLYKEWIDSGMQEMKIPTCDRLDNTKGYSFNNIRIVTWHENIKQAALDRKTGIDKTSNRPVKQYSKKGEFIQSFHSRAEAARAVNGCPRHICACISGRQKTSKGFIWRD